MVVSRALFSTAQALKLTPILPWLSRQLAALAGCLDGFAHNGIYALKLGMNRASYNVPTGTSVLARKISYRASRKPRLWSVFLEGDFPYLLYEV